MLPSHYTYFAYGLTIRSSVRLPELIEIDAPANVVVHFGKIPEEIIQRIESRNSDSSIFLFWENEGKLHVRGGQEIVVDPAPDVDDRVLRLIILGPGLAVLLHQRGLLALHGATVAIDGRAISILGHPGCGKSALAANLFKRGHLIMADDVTAIELNGKDPPLAHSGFPQLKLWPDVVLSLGFAPENLSCIEPGFEKRAFPITRRFSLEPFPMERIYILSEGEKEEIVPLSPQEALLALICHTYRAPLLKWIGAGRHLLQCATLINKVPIKQLNRPPLISGLHDAARMVEKDLALG
jgi:HPr Serine kinase C-terminal domain